MLTVGDTLPAFSLKGLVSVEPGREFREISSTSYEGKWLVMFYWPLSFSRDYPSELAEFARRYPDFLARNADVLGASTDAPYVHLAWRKEHPALHALPYPTLADFRRDLARRLGVVQRHDCAPLRATFIIDPEGIIRWSAAYDPSIDRNVAEIVRMLDALQSARPNSGPRSRVRITPRIAACDDGTSTAVG